MFWREKEEHPFYYSQNIGIYPEDESEERAIAGPSLFTLRVTEAVSASEQENYN